MSPITTEQLRAEVLGAAVALAGEGMSLRQEIALERPPRAELGDYSTNAALLLAPSLGAPPREVAQRLGAELKARLGDGLDRFEVAGPGFLNLFLHPRWFAAALSEVLKAGERFGAGGASAPERVLVEFVSANPTGPMHVGHARNAAYGDALARVLSLHGHEVVREFYVNDAGSQVLKLGESLLALARGEEVGEDGYRGDYVPALLVEVKEALGVSDVASRAPAELGAAAVKAMVVRMQSSLAAFRVSDFDQWAYESSLHAPRADLKGPDGGAISPVDHALALLEQSGHTYRSDGALWLRTSDFGDDKDRVLVRSSGEHTYFASDIAYHQDKRERGFERQIDVWGADHH
ncbi:MAG TPA: arginine--tRNA ligase, partial [Solirubrobacteraceae bacterium]